MEQEQTMHAVQRNFKKMLALYDLNRDQSMDYNELFLAFIRSGRTYGQAQALAKEIFARLDRNHDGKVTLSEALAQFCRQAMAPETEDEDAPDQDVQEMVHEWQLHFVSLLEMYDRNGDRSLNFDEVTQALLAHGWGDEKAREFARALFSALDRDHDGRITIAEAFAQL